MPSHHDELFQHLMSHDDDLRAHLQAVLGPDLTANIDWDGMIRLPTVLHDPAEREIRSDLMVLLPSSHGLFVVILVYEHQSHPTRDITLRITRYLLRALQAHDDPSPVIPIDIVLTHDLSAWPAPPSLIPKSLRDHPLVQHFGRAVLDLQPIVIDLERRPESRTETAERGSFVGDGTTRELGGPSDQGEMASTGETRQRSTGDCLVGAL